MKKTTKTITTIGTAVASTLSINIAQAESNPFAISELDSGYMQIATCDKAGEMACGSKMEAKKEAACGEGMCGGMMNGDKMKAGMEKSCGAMMKGKEGACGDMKAGKEMSCGAMMKGKEGACGDMKATAKKEEVTEKEKGYSVNTGGWGNKKPKAEAKGKEGKCGEGKCGDMMKGDKMKKGLEKSCGAMMKGKEGACGVMDK